MGKARIVGGGTGGQYTVELLHNRVRINAEIEALNARIAALEEELAPLETEREELVAERNAIASEIDEAVAATAEGEIPDVEALLVELAQVAAQIQSFDVRIAMLQVRILQAEQRRRMLQAVPADPQQSAWCADFTEDLTGEVATVEVPAEGVVGQFATWRRMQIRPGFEGRATYSAARDGQMFHREGQVGYQAYYNACILPGVQRHKPQYRIGVITAIDKEADTCSLTIQGEDSSAQALIIDPPDLQYAKTGVPIEYMECNAEVFEIGDRVVVEFQGRSWGSPKVIGFEKDPRPCEKDVHIWERPFRVVVPMGTTLGRICSGGDPDHLACEKAGSSDSTISYSPELELVGQLGDNHLNFARVFHAEGFGTTNGAPIGGWLLGELSGTSVATPEGPAYSEVSLNYYYNAHRFCYLVQDDLYAMCLSGSEFNLIWSPTLSVGDIPDFVIGATTYEAIGFMSVDGPVLGGGRSDLIIGIGFQVAVV